LTVIGDLQRTLLRALAALSTLAAGIVGWRVFSGHLAAAWLIAGSLGASAIAGAILLLDEGIPVGAPPTDQPAGPSPGAAGSPQGEVGERRRLVLRALLVLSTTGAGVVGWRVMSGALAAGWVIGGALASSVLAGAVLLYPATPGAPWARHDKPNAGEPGSAVEQQQSSVGA
jgi:hypothetical protein